MTILLLCGPGNPTGRSFHRRVSIAPPRARLSSSKITSLIRTFVSAPSPSGFLDRQGGEGEREEGRKVMLVRKWEGRKKRGLYYVGTTYFGEEE